MPSARSRVREPVDTTSTSRVAAWSPKRITEPLPNCFSIWPSAAARAFLRLSSIGIGTTFRFAFMVVFLVDYFTNRTKLNECALASQFIARERRVAHTARQCLGTDQREVAHFPHDASRWLERPRLTHPARQGDMGHELAGRGGKTRDLEPAAQFHGEPAQRFGPLRAAVPDHLGVGPETHLVQLEREGRRLHLVRTAFGASDDSLL